MTGTRDSRAQRAQHARGRRRRAGRDRAGRPPASRASSSRRCLGDRGPASTTRVAVAGERRAQEAAHLRLVLDDEHAWLMAQPLRPRPREHGRRRCGAGSAIGTRAPPPGAILGVERAAVRLDDARARPRGPRPAPGARRPRARTSRTAARVSGGQRRGRDRATSIVDARRLALRARSRAAAAPCLAAFSSRLISTCSNSTGSTEQRQVRRDVERRPARSPSASSSRVSARADELLDRHPLALGLERRSRRASAASRFASTRSSRSRLLDDRRRAARARRRGQPVAVVAQRGRRAGDHRERRAQIVRHRRQQRAAQLLGLRAQRRARAPRSASRTRSSASAAWRASASSSWRWSTSSRGGVPRRRWIASTPTRVVAATSGTREHARAGQRVGAVARRLRRARTPSARRASSCAASGISPAAATQAARRRRAPARPPRRRARPRGAARCTAATSLDVVGRGEVAREREQRGGAALALRSRRAPGARRRDGERR